MDMEEELTAQRDAAIAVTKELQKQLHELRAEVEKKFERRALNAERLRLHAEAELTRVREERDWELQMSNRVLYLALFAGMIGALVGWCFGLQMLLLFGQPLMGFLMILPAMMAGSLIGLAIAKTKAQLESRRRDAKKKRIALHTEVERVMNSAMDASDTPLDALEDIPGMAREEVHEVNRNATASSSEDLSVAAAASSSATTGNSILSTCAGLAWQTLHVSKDVALNLYYTKDPMRGALSGGTSDPTTASRDRKKDQ